MSTRVAFYTISLYFTLYVSFDNKVIIFSSQVPSNLELKYKFIDFVSASSHYCCLEVQGLVMPNP